MHKLYRWMFRIASGVFLIGIVGLIIIMALTNVAMDEMDDILSLPYVSEQDNVIVFQQEDYLANIVIYPGGLVEAHAYAKLAYLLHEEGYRVFIVRMPLNLAILNRGAFEDIVGAYESEFPWYGLGHSLGGASLAYVDVGLLEGLILLGSYFPGSVDISETDLNVLSITAEFDEVLDWDNYEARKTLLPSGSVHVMIAGGNHANFGYYGSQRGDGDATISRLKQHQLVVAEIVSFID